MTDLLKPDPQRRTAERMEKVPEAIRLGSWHWLKVQTNKGAITERFVCVTGIGSNYAEVQTPGGSSWRIHFDEWDDETRPEPNHKAVIEEEISEKKKAISGLMTEVQAVTARLGMTPVSADETGTALAVLSGQADVDGYKTALVKAQKEELPALFEKIENENKALAKWMKAEILPVKAVADRAKLAIKEIEGRILNVEIYAGITEEVKEVRKGESARYDEKLRVFQAKLFMDEEALLDYRAGGLDFAKIGDFDRWLAKRKNLERILPFPRCMVAMQVRRTKKDRGGDESYEGVLGTFLRFKHDDFDKWTFLYVRNGERLYRINSKIKFGDLIFPSKNEFSVEPMVFKGSGSSIEFKTVREHEVDKAAAIEKARLREEWNKKNPYKKWAKAKKDEWKAERAEKLATAKREEADGKRRSGYAETVREMQEREKFDGPSDFSWENANPHGHDREDPSRFFDSWEPFDKSSVHYDEALEVITNRARQWNRVALMIQGLFDRSELLHPHPKVESWTPEGFASAIELLYDGENALHAGAQPDFEAYRARINESLGPDSVTIGQEKVWLARAQAKENARRDGDYRLKWSEKQVKDWWKPYDDVGPGYLARVAKWAPRSRKARFHWTRNRRGGAFRYADERGLEIRMSIQVEAKDLFHASGYVKNDFLQFFRDPRTRANYMKWAPILLTCEDWLAGKVKPQEPDPAKEVE